MSLCPFSTEGHTVWGCGRPESKVEGLTKALAEELPRGMAAVPLNPGIINTRMLQSCFGGSAGQYPLPEAWAAQAGPFILGLGAKQNGGSVSV